MAVYKLTEELRKELKAPLGKLMNSEQFLKEVRSNGYLISVGDESSFLLLKNRIEPDLMIVDNRIRREEAPKEVQKKIAGYSGKEIPVDNPPSEISESLQKEVKNAIENCMKTKIVVTGEEDLAVLPCMRYAKEGSRIVYGQPHEGIVLINVNQNTRGMVNRILDRMEVV